MPPTKLHRLKLFIIFIIFSGLGKLYQLYSGHPWDCIPLLTMSLWYPCTDSRSWYFRLFKDNTWEDQYLKNLRMKKKPNDGAHRQCPLKTNSLYCTNTPLWLIMRTYYSEVPNKRVGANKRSKGEKLIHMMEFFAYYLCENCE